MIDLSAETPLPLVAAAATIPPARAGKKTHISTLLRWILSGAKAPDGERIRLEAVRMGGRWLTSREALQRFAERLTPHVGDSPEIAAPRTSSRQQRGAERAGEKLKALNI